MNRYFRTSLLAVAALSVFSLNTVSAKPTQAATLQLHFSSPGVDGLASSKGTISFKPSGVNESNSSDVGIYQNIITNYDLKITGKEFQPGLLTNSGETFKVEEAEVRVSPKNSNVTVAFGHGAELNLNFAPGTITSTKLPTVGEIGKAQTNNVSFTPGARYSRNLENTSVYVSADIISTSIPESNNGLASLFVGSIGLLSWKSKYYNAK
jgi:hypothetical protein